MTSTASLTHKVDQRPQPARVRTLKADSPASRRAAPDQAQPRWGSMLVRYL
jgi:hypothetical protein